MQPSSAFVAILIFCAALLALAWLSRHVSLQIQQVVYNLTGSMHSAVAVYFLVLLPGIFVHEASHWVVALVLGLEPGRFTVWPKVRGTMIGLGSVTAKRGGMVLDSLVGMAPLVAGTLLVGLLARIWLGGALVDATLASGGVAAWVEVVRSAFLRPDAPIWAYLIFTIANGMMPSAPDREPVKPLLVYVSLGAILYVVLGLPLNPLRSALDAAVSPLMALNSALVITVLLDVVAVLLLVLLAALTRPLRRSRV
jgi:hypothetical protein